MVEKVTHQNFDEVLPLIKKYQEFYKVTDIDEEKNNKYFSKLIDSHNDGVLFIIRVNGNAIGFATIYRGFSSTRAEEVAILNDLYIEPTFRNKGYAKKLISAAITEAKNRGYSRLQWLTARDNKKAQILYDSLGAEKSEWFFYAIKT